MFDFMVWRSRFAGPTEYEIDHRTAKKQTTMYCTPCPHYVATNSPMSAWRTRFDVARKNKNKQNKQTKTSATGSAPQENQTTMYAPPSLRRDKLSHVCLVHPLSGMRCDHRRLRFR